MADLTAQLAAHARALEPLRTTNALANDMFEAADDWRSLGELLVERGDATDLRGRAQQERELLALLLPALEKASPADQARYRPIIDAGIPLIEIAETHVPGPDGEMGFLRLIRERFAFLTARGFALVRSHPGGARFSSEHASVCLVLSPQAYHSCTFGRASNPHPSYELQDLLFLYDDPAWQTFPQTVELDTPEQMDRWFTYAADLLQRYGAELLAGAPDFFARIATASDQRDAAYVKAMNERYLPKP